MEMVPWCPLGAGKVCRGETRQPETAVEQRQVLKGWGHSADGHRQDCDGFWGDRGWEETTQSKGTQLKKSWYVEQRMLMKSRRVCLVWKRSED